MGIRAIVFREAWLLLRMLRIDLSTPVRQRAAVILPIPWIEAVRSTPGIAPAADGLAMHADPTRVMASRCRCDGPFDVDSTLPPARSE